MEQIVVFPSGGLNDYMLLWKFQTLNVHPPSFNPTPSNYSSLHSSPAHSVHLSNNHNLCCTSTARQAQSLSHNIKLLTSNIFFFSCFCNDYRRARQGPSVYQQPCVPGHLFFSSLINTVICKWLQLWPSNFLSKLPSFIVLNEQMASPEKKLQQTPWVTEHQPLKL